MTAHSIGVSVETAIALARETAAKDPHRAKKMCQEILQQAPNTPSAWLLIGDIEANAGNYSAAEECYGRLLKNPVEGLRARLRLAELFSRGGRHAEANRLLAQVSETAVDASVLDRMGEGRSWVAPIKLRPNDIRQANPAFSLGGEDIILRKHFKRRLLTRSPGFYVDIGANAPVEASNTYLFYCYGWRGICIDVLGSFANDFAAIRPRDLFVKALVAETESEVRFQINTKAPGMSKVLRPDEVPSSKDAVIEMVRGRRLDSICAEHLPPRTPIDFFSIDVEGAEMAVLQSNDWERFRPAAIVMEAHDCRPDAPTAAESVGYLRTRGYEILATVPPNVFLADTRTA